MLILEFTWYYYRFVFIFPCTRGRNDCTSSLRVTNPHVKPGRDHSLFRNKKFSYNLSHGFNYLYSRKGISP